jgi:type I restriction-modification system DNA methylase subunit
MNSHFPLPDSLAEGRTLLTLDVSAARRKQLGQCFTGLQTGRLLAALAVRPGQKRVVDPMAGHGDLIESAAERARHLGLNAVELLGVEIEPEAARLCQWRIEQCMNEFGATDGTFVHGDAFALNTWESVLGFDLVITNPPYVRYQTLSNGGQVGTVVPGGFDGGLQLLGQGG